MIIRPIILTARHQVVPTKLLRQYSRIVEVLTTKKRRCHLKNDDSKGNNGEWTTGNAYIRREPEKSLDLKYYYAHHQVQVHT